MADGGLGTTLAELLEPRPASEWHEGLGSVLWWKFPIEEPPYVGSPLDCGQTVEIKARYVSSGEVRDKVQRIQVGGWPGYHTHFTLIPKVKAP